MMTSIFNQHRQEEIKPSYWAFSNDMFGCDEVFGVSKGYYG